MKEQNTESVISLRRAVSADDKLLFAWANDIDVRKNAFEQHEISWEEHTQWFRRKLSDKDCYIYIASVNDRPVGQIRLDIEDNRALIDYSVDAASRGRGYGSKMLAQALALPGLPIDFFLACVKDGNTASAKAFEKCGFQKSAQKQGYAEFIKHYEAGGRERILICTQKSFHAQNAEKLRERYLDKYDISVITKKEELTREALDALKPKYVFFPHWSYIIPEHIFSVYPCVVFHMTDLPFGRGGSPLQNLIVRGFTHTKLSALRVEKGLDTGDIYLKEELELSGTADEILKRCSEIIFEKMIPYILEKNPVPVPQQGEAVVFKRRKPEDGRLFPEMEDETIYDYIRMLDGEGYPRAFLEFGNHRLCFEDAQYENGKLTAKVIFEVGKES